MNNFFKDIQMELMLISVKNRRHPSKISPSQFLVKHMQLQDLVLKLLIKELLIF